MPDIEQRLNLVHARIDKTATACRRRPEDIALLAVSKTRPAEEIRLAAACGQRAFGENYLQEALPKIGALADLGLSWHFIGPIQSNKTQDIAQHFDWVHSVDRIKIAQRLSQQRPPKLPPLQVCLQVNISGEASKSGFEPAELTEAASEIQSLASIELRGLMAIPRASTERLEQRLAFARLRELLETLQRQGIELDTLSMGMSGDLEAAILEGSTLVRIGTDVFGPRRPQ